MTTYLSERQNAVTTANPAELEGMLAAIARNFGLGWLTQSGNNPVQILWNRRDALATNELLNFGNAIAEFETVDANWLDRQVDVIKTSDAGNRAGAIFELLALNFFRAAGNKVIPSPGNNPGYDGIVELKDGSSLVVSLKNHGLSSNENDFIKKAAALDQKFQEWLQQQALNGVEVRIFLAEHPFASDWRELEADLKYILENIKTKPQAEIVTKGRWEIVFKDVDPQYSPLSKHHLTSSFFIWTTAHQNEQVNFMESIRRGVQNLIKHTKNMSASNCPALFVRLSATASMKKCAEWADAYFKEYPNEPIGLIFLYQVAVVTEKNSSFISHCIVPVFGPTLRSWAAPVNAPPRRLPNMTVAVGVMLSEPSKKVVMTDRGQIALDDSYTYQRADIYRHYKMGAQPLNMNLSNPAPGVMIHAEVEIGGESGALKMIAPVQADLLLLP
jgi:hypothetical protein